MGQNADLDNRLIRTAHLAELRGLANGLRQAYFMAEEQREAILGNPSGPSWTEHLGIVGAKIKLRIHDIEAASKRIREKYEDSL